MIISLRLESDGLRYRYLIRWETFYQYLVNSRKVHTPSLLEGKIYSRFAPSFSNFTAVTGRKRKMH